MRGRHTRTRHFTPTRFTALFVLGILCALGIGAALFFWPKTADKTVPSALVPEGGLKGLAITMDTTDEFLSLTTEEAQKEWLAKAAAFAAQSGRNALFVQVYAENDVRNYVLFRGSGAYALPGNVTDNDTLLHRFDPLEYLCEQASANGLAVYAYLPSYTGLADTAEGQKMLARMQRRYAIADVVQQVATDSPDETFGVYATLDGTAEFPYTTAQAWAAPQDVFLQSLQTEGSGFVVQDLATARLLPDVYRQFVASQNDSHAVPTLLDFTLDDTLRITYPSNGMRMTTKNVYLMGTSDGTQPLLLNGQDVMRGGTQGTFGALVTLEKGENTFVLQNGVQTETITLYYGTAGTSASGGTTSAADSTVAVEPGTYVQVANWISSLLYDPSADNYINETVRKGAVAQVVNSVQVTRSGKKTWAYQLTSGDFVLAYNTTVLGKEYALPSFSSAIATPLARGEKLAFTGSGTPVAYSNRIDNTLVLHFYDANFAADFAVQGSTMVQSTTVTAHENYTEVVLAFAAPLWGHTVEYENGTVAVYLKQAPVQSKSIAQPLAGVSVLLDAGHGDTDTGAMGVAGFEAPTEKDVNLAVALAAKYRLQQLGATVEMVRTDDTFLSLAERNALITTTQPDFFIALHHNSQELTSDANTNGGVEAYYFYDSGKQLAQTLVQKLATALNRRDRGAMWGYYYVTRNTTCPAVLFEIGFMVNPAEYEQVIDEDNLWRTGDIIAQSVLACVPRAE